MRHFSSSPDRFIRHAVVRQLDHLINTPYGKPRRVVFNLLLSLAKGGDSDWIRQEAGRALAHFMDTHYSDLFVYLYLLFANKVEPHILRHIAYNTSTAFIQNVLRNLEPLAGHLNDANVLEKLEQAMQALEETRSLRYGEETWMIYNELRRLFNTRTVDDIAQYQSTLTPNPATNNKYFPIVSHIVHQLNSITRKLKIYLGRDSLDDRLTGLLEAIDAIDKMYRAIEREYAALVLGGPTKNLPDRRILELLLKRWRSIVEARLGELRGKAELEPVLRTRRVRHETQIAVWLVVGNRGRSSANNVKVTLLSSKDFDVIGRNSFETETILTQEESLAEFIIRPHSTAPDLIFEIIYDDAEREMKVLTFGDRLELQEVEQRFREIPNPYSTGIPTLDSKMFYGREADVALLKDNLTRPVAKTVMVLYGQRRSGKTTLLLQLANTPVLEKHVLVLIDMQREAYGISVSKFLYDMALYIVQAFKKRGVTLHRPDRHTFEVNPTFAFDEFLDEVETHLGERKLILLIDEFEVLEEQVVKKKLEEEIFGYLRSLMQHRQNINFLLAGTHKIERQTRGYWSVFFNIARHHYLSRLSKSGAQELIVGPVEGFLEYEPHAIEKIHQLTAGQPYLIHLICRSLVDYCNEQQKTYATINDVNIVLREVMQTGKFHFSWIWDQIEPPERIALAVLAEGGREEGRLLSLTEIAEIYRHYRLPYKPEQVLTALNALIDMDTVESVASEMQTGDSHDMRFRIPVGLTRIWLRQEKPPEQVMREELSHD
jgi:AAA+ ATPase superfamily predicted ATPase